MEWAEHNMPVLRSIRQRFEKEKPLRGMSIGACLHVTTETGVLATTLAAGGAQVSLCASNPLSTQDDVASCLAVKHGIATYAIKGEDHETYYRHIESVLDSKPKITMDDGADLVSMIHTKRRDLLPGILGGTEETTTGVIRLESLASEGALAYPIIAVNNADTKHLFDNRYGTGQSTLDGIIRATNLLVAGLKFVICGYGWCGRGVAQRARGLGANVVIIEVEPVKALEAVMDGFTVSTLSEAVKSADVIVTLTGNKHVLRKEHFTAMKDGVILANSGHFNVEIDIPALQALSGAPRRLREFVESFTLSDGKRIHLLGEGRLINLAAAEGHPAMVMDMSFANQALSVEHLVRKGSSLAKGVYSVPPEIDREIARLKLASMGIVIDRLTEEQERYLNSWTEGT
ncbi:MAG: adenosylhomocysteinase [Acidobacteria bacterium]|nr:adenosylhomocysteinase [Acidobacteriota bacterium]